LPDPAATTRCASRRGRATSTQAARHATDELRREPIPDTDESKMERVRAPGQLDQAAMAEWVRQNRQDQGLPATIRDPETLDRFAALVVEGVVRLRRKA
jgi:hypothetical protein